MATADSGSKKRTIVLGLLAGLMVLGFAGYRGLLYYQGLTKKARPAVASVSKKTSSSNTSDSKQAGTPAEQPQQSDPLPDVPTDSTEQAPDGQAPSTTDPNPAGDATQPKASSAKDPMGADFSTIVGRMPPEKTVTEPDPRQTGGFQGEIFVRLDLNGDLKLEPIEIPTYYREQMLACDTNNDGRINFTEFRDAIGKLPEPPATRSTVPASALINPPLPGQEIPIYERAADRKAKDAPLWFTNYDRSGDGHIAVYEWPAGRLNEFRALDVNNDGFITLEEAKKAEQLKQQMEPPTPPTDQRSTSSTSPFRPAEVTPRLVGR
jgi:hypothetical protein